MKMFDVDDDLNLPLPCNPPSPLHKPKLKRLKMLLSPNRGHQEMSKAPDAPIVLISSPSPQSIEFLSDSNIEGFRKEIVPTPDHDFLLASLDCEEIQDDRPMAGLDLNEEKMCMQESVKENKVKRRLRLEGEEEDTNMNNKKKGISRKLQGPDGKPKESAREIANIEKARMDELAKLHAESQRLLRETRDASFKPGQLMQKPLSSVLEKIRLRKLEMLKRSSILNSMPSAIDSDYAAASNCNLLSTNSLSGIQESDRNSKDLCVGSKDSFLTMTNDSQANNGNFQSSSRDDNLLNVLEVSLPSNLSTSNLKIEDDDNGAAVASSSDYDDSSSEEESDKENIHPSFCNVVKKNSSPKASIAKVFLDDEAEEEDDSDCDLLRFRENEEEEEEEANGQEDIDGLISKYYEELPKDQDIRNDLHQKWIEKQDAAETDNVLQRLKSGLGHKKAACFNDDYDGSADDNDDDGDDSDDEHDDESKHKNHRIDASHHCFKMAKQTISHMFTDAKDAYIHSDDEEMEKDVIRRHILTNKEEVSFISPVEDENSKEFFSLIKKLNIAPSIKKRGKLLAPHFDSLIVSGTSNSSSKSSFLNRTSNSLPPPRKQGSCSVRTFIFGRDDSNSCSNISAPDNNTDMDESKELKNSMKEKQLSSQPQSGINKRKAQAQSESGPSLFSILRQSSIQFDKKLESRALGGNHEITESQADFKFSAFKLRKTSKLNS